MKLFDEIGVFIPPRPEHKNENDTYSQDSSGNKIETSSGRESN